MFARNAKQLFCERDDVELVASHRGLTIRGETEDVIAAAVVVLKDLYDRMLRLEPLTIRYHQGAALEQPWMGLRVRCIPRHLEAVNADLIDRNARIVACDIEPGMCVIQACAPLADLLGYRSALEKLTAGSAQHAMWLSHYAPVQEFPPDGHAA
jgi:translation elongation factor EF-G